MNAAGRLALALLLGACPLAHAGTQPVITDFSPGFGAPGATVVINGQNFGGASAVLFNGLPTVNFSVTAPTQIQVTVPAGATTGPIGVRTSAGAAFSVDSFVVIGAGPYITDFSPTVGSPGDPVVIDGVNFTGVTAVRFNGTNAAFTVVGPTQLSAWVPANATTGPITVATTAGTNTTTSNFVAVGYGPYVTDFSPDHGQPGDSVVINGLNYDNATAVKFNGTNAPLFTVTAQTQISVHVPTGATTGPITVATLLGTNTSANVFVVGDAPVITDFAPTNGVSGTVVVVNGGNFLGATTVWFNGTNAPFFFVTADSQLSVQVPAGATTGPITVATPDGTNTSADLFVVLQPPGIIGFTPGTGPPTTTVSVVGTNFIGASEVLFNGTGSIFTVNSSTNLTATVPPTATTGPIIVVSPAGTAFSTNAFVVTVPTTPTITSITPAGGPIGTAVTILGTQFVNVLAVKFNGVIAGATTVSSTEIDAVVPSGASTGLISVTTRAGTVTSTNSFAVGPAPVIAGFLPTNGPAGTRVTITGSGFLGTAAVQFNGVTAPFIVNAPSQITAQVPPAAYSGPITIITPTGTGFSATDFIVQRLADLLLQASLSATQVNVGSLLTNAFTLLNQGPSDATGVTFTNSLPDGLRLVSAGSTAGTVSSSSNRVTVLVGGLPVGAGVTLTLVIVPTAVGTITNTATVAANEADQHPADRVATAVVTALAPALAIRPAAAGLVEIGWPSAATGFKLQVTGRLAPASWVDSTGTPALVGSRYLVTNPVSASPGFYRLRPAP